MNDAQPGSKRLKSGAGFRYVDARGKELRDEATLRRIRSLVIPPAWTEVWICPHENGHLQATGRDAKGRKQHRYHALWREVRDATKYDRMIEFGEALPRIRRRIASDMEKTGLSREKVLGSIVRLMDLTFIRVGNEEYAKENKSYGLTTMKDNNAKVRGERVQFSFQGKSGKCHTIEIEDRRLANIVKHCQDIPGQDLFQWIGDRGKRHNVTSSDVNDYLREITGAGFTAKDFRTWAGTVLAAQALQSTAAFKTEKQARRNIKQAIDMVAEKLGNTPAVCRKCYVHPSLLDGYLRKKLPSNGPVKTPPTNGVITASKRLVTSLGREEKAILEFLHCCRREEQNEVKRMKSRLTAVPRVWRPRWVRGMRAARR
ncbi:MAG TPA: DNA topoisomerase IB [Candidatus Limnocylindria bacterium]|nr:DNA topoisomerase IB [Candidatus Limnocylindria bacterium]